MPVGIHVKVHLPDVKTGDVETMLFARQRLPSNSG